MDQFTEADELDETGVLFACGQDLLGRPTLVARPTVHESSSRQESLTAARRTVFTVQRCCEFMPIWLEEQKVIIIYDCRGLKRANLDLTYTREIIRTLLAQFPERLDRVIVINSHWTMAFFWAAIKALLPSDIVAKVLICSSETSMCKELLPEDHPYILYDAAVRRGGLVPGIPKRSPHRVAMLAPKADVEGEAEENESSDEELEPEPAMLGDDWSRQSTSASGTEAAATPKKERSFSPWHPYGAEAAVTPSLHPEVGRTFAEVAEAAVERKWWSAGCCGHSKSHTRTSL